MKNLKLIVVYILYLTLTTSCEDVIEFKGKDIGNFIVVNSVLEADSAIFCSVTSSKTAFSNEGFRILDNANVELYIDGKLEVAMIYDEYRYEFKVPEDIKVEIGKEYSVKVQYPKFNDVEASCVIEPKINATVKSILFGDSEIDYDYDYGFGDIASEALKFQVELEDKPGEGFYQIAVLVPEVMFGDEVGSVEILKPVRYNKLKYLNSTDEVLNHNVYKGSDEFSDVAPNSFGIFNDALFDGEKRNLKFEVAFDVFSLNNVEKQLIDEYKSLVKVDIRKISKDLYLYYRTRESIDYNEGYPFVEPINLHSNIIGGSGVWGASTSNIISMEK